MSPLHSQNDDSRIPLSALVLLALLFGLSFLSPNYGLRSAEAMGPAPGSCANEYPSNFASFTVNNGTQNINVMTNPDITFTALASEGYNVSFVLHTANVSSDGNTAANGTTWISTDWGGYISNTCIVGQGVNGTWAETGNGTVGPNENLSLTGQGTCCATYGPDVGAVGVYWGINGPPQSSVYYSVIWLEPTTMNLSCSTNNGSATCVSTVSTHDSHFSYVGAPSGNVTFTTGSSTVGYCTLKGLYDFSSCSLSFTLAMTGLITIEGSYNGDIGNAASNNLTTFNCCAQTTSTTSSSSSATSTSSNPTTSTTSSTSSSSTTSVSDTTTSTTSLRSTSSDNTNSSQPSTSTILRTASPSGGLNYTDSVSALVLSVVVIAGILIVALRKSW